MRVGVDGRHLRPTARRGVARYERLLLSELAARSGEDSYVAVVPGGMADPIPGVEPRVARRAVLAAAALAGRPRLDRLAGGCDVAWVPAPAPIAVSPGVPLVLTVHDLSFEHRPRDFGRYERLWHRLARPRALARRARRVIAVSEAVRTQLLGEWGLEPGRVVTVASGPGAPPAQRGELPPGAEPGFVLAVGALEPRKRPGLLVEAHRRARARGLRAGLVLAGEGPLRAELERSGATLPGFVPDAVLEALYASALALVCVSGEEGFGLTPLEAAARGTPAIVSALPPFAETLGDAALRVSPDDPEALADALLRMEREPDLRERLARAGAAAAARLSWAQAARATRAILAEAAAEGERSP